MAVIALAGCSGAPGVTTSALALLLSWPLEAGRRMILAECDPDGGAVLHGLLQGTLGDRYGLRNLSVAARKGEFSEAFWRQLIDLSSEDGAKESPRDRLLLPGLTDPAQSASLGQVWKVLAQMFRGIEAESGHDVLIDLGRRGADGPSGILAEQADATFVVVRNTLRCLQAAESRVRALEERVGDVSVLMVNEGPYPAGEVQRVLQVPVIATLPYAPKDARVLSDGVEQPRHFSRSALMKAARTGGTLLLQRAAMRRDHLDPRGGMPAPDGLNPVSSGNQCVQTYSQRTQTDVWHFYDDMRQAAPTWKEVCGRSTMSNWMNTQSMQPFPSQFTQPNRMLEKDAYWYYAPEFSGCSATAATVKCTVK